MEFTKFGHLWEPVPNIGVPVLSDPTLPTLTYITELVGPLNLGTCNGCDANSDGSILAWTAQDISPRLMMSTWNGSTGSQLTYTGGSIGWAGYTPRFDSNGICHMSGRDATHVYVEGFTNNGTTFTNVYDNNILDGNAATSSFMDYDTSNDRLMINHAGFGTIIYGEFTGNPAPGAGYNLAKFTPTGAVITGNPMLDRVTGLWWIPFLDSSSRLHISIYQHNGSGSAPTELATTNITATGETLTWYRGKVNNNCCIGHTRTEDNVWAFIYDGASTITNVNFGSDEGFSYGVSTTQDLLDTRRMLMINSGISTAFPLDNAVWFWNKGGDTNPSVIGHDSAIEGSSFLTTYQIVIMNSFSYNGNYYIMYGEHSNTGTDLHVWRVDS